MIQVIFTDNYQLLLRSYKKPLLVHEFEYQKYKKFENYTTSEALGKTHLKNTCSRRFCSSSDLVRHLVSMLVMLWNATYLHICTHNKSKWTDIYAFWLHIRTHSDILHLCFRFLILIIGLQVQFFCFFDTTMQLIMLLMIQKHQVGVLLHFS